MIRNFLLLAGLWYLNTSFQISENRSLNLEDEKVVSQSIGNSDSTKIYTKSPLDLLGNNTYHIDLGQKYTAVKITSLDTQSNTIHITAGSEEIDLGSTIEDANADIPTSFIVFLEPTENLKLVSKFSVNIQIELFYASPIDFQSRETHKTKNDCDKPITITQTEWRKGLPDPIAGREATVVKHCVIHHSAGNNADTNYVNIIRNIYLLHTQSNGWDDIGYNYVIAPNGVIFSGRDPQGIADEDNIMGAHFCAKNSATMGICLLGNYNLKSPEIEMSDALAHLLTWKLSKEELSPFDAYPHPNSAGDDLPTITLHQSGCATECPGDSVAFYLSDLVDDVNTRIDNCGKTTQIKSTKNYRQLIYPNPSSGRFYVMIEKEANADNYIIRNNLGQEVHKNQLAPNGLIYADIPKGIYFLDIYNTDLLISSSKIVIN